MKPASFHNGRSADAHRATAGADLAGFMLPDTLPILGNGYGDWLCMRVNADNTAGEVVHWYHGGGDWMPWGRNPAEAIAFDRLRQRLPGRRVAHATRPAEPSTDPTLPDPWPTGPLVTCRPG